MPGWRPRDLASGNFPQLRGKALANYTSDPVFQEMTGPDPDLGTLVLTWVGTFGGPVTWDDLAWLRSLTDLPLVLKGICHPDDARRALDEGVDGIYCSNHGGRQANGGGGAVDWLPGVVDAVRSVSDTAPVVFDSGVRTGADVVKALALGATAVAVGRPYVYALALGGVPGLVHLLRSLQAETDLVMAVDGYPTRADLVRDAVVDLQAPTMTGPSAPASSPPSPTAARSASASTRTQRCCTRGGSTTTSPASRPSPSPSSRRWRRCARW